MVPSLPSRLNIHGFWLISTKAFHHCPGKAGIDSGQKRLRMVALGRDVWVICPFFIHITDEIKSHSGDTVGEGAKKS